MCFMKRRDFLELGNAHPLMLAFAMMSEATLFEPALKVLRSMARPWAGLLVFIDHPLVPMDNNIAERAHRTPVVGRKNFYGSGSLWSGQLAAELSAGLLRRRCDAGATQVRRR